MRPTWHIYISVLCMKDTSLAYLSLSLWIIHRDTTTTASSSHLRITNGLFTLSTHHTRPASPPSTPPNTTTTITTTVPHHVHTSSPPDPERRRSSQGCAAWCINQPRLRHLLWYRLSLASPSRPKSLGCVQTSEGANMGVDGRLFLHLTTGAACCRPSLLN